VATVAVDLAADDAIGSLAGLQVADGPVCCWILVAADTARKPNRRDRRKFARQCRSA